MSLLLISWDVQRIISILISKDVDRYVILFFKFGNIFHCYRISNPFHVQLIFMYFSTLYPFWRTTCKWARILQRKYLSSLFWIFKMHHVFAIFFFFGSSNTVNLWVVCIFQSEVWDVTPHPQPIQILLFEIPDRQQTFSNRIDQLIH